MIINSFTHKSTLALSNVSRYEAAGRGVACVCVQD